MSAAVLDESGEDGGGGGGEEEELTNLSWLHNCGAAALSLSNGIGGATNSSKVTEFLQGNVGQERLIKTFCLAL